MSRAGFDPISPAFDTPELQASLALDGELTARGLRLSLFDPSGLSPAERETIASRAKKGAGGGPFVGAAIDILTNPWAWFFFATSPAGTGALGHTAKVMFSGSQKAAAFLAEHGTLLQRFGMITGLQEAGEGVSGPAMLTAGRLVQSSRNRELLTLGPDLHNLLIKHDLPNLMYERIGDPVKRDLARRINIATEAYLSGWDRSAKEVRLVAKKTGASPTIRGLDPTDTVGWQAIHTWGAGNKARTLWLADITHAPIMQPGTARSLLEQVAGPEGVKYADAQRVHFNEVLREVWGKPGTGPFVPDPDKLLATWRMYRNPAFQGGAKRGVVEGLNLIRQAMGPMFNEVEMGKLPFDKWMQVVEKVGFAPVQSEAYFPKTVWEHFKNGKSVQQRVDAGLIPQSLRAGGAITRGATMAIYAPEDLRLFKNMTGSSGKVDRMIQQADRVMQQSFDPRFKWVRMLRMNADAALQKYTQRMTAVGALSAPLAQRGPAGAWGPTEAGRAILDANSRTVARGLYRESGLAAVPRVYGRGIDASGKVVGDLDMRASISTHLRGGQTPLGGFTVADALAADLAHMRNPYSLKRISEVYLPRVLGLSPNLQSSALRDTFITAKEQVAGFADSPLMKKVAAQGGYAAKWVGGLKAWATAPTTPGEVGYTSGKLAKYIYGTHLSFNPGSVLMNASQTLGPALNIYGLKHMAAGWGMALEDLGRYVKEWKPGMNEMDRIDAIKRSVRASTAGVSGTDPVGITPQVFEVLEGQLGQTGRVLASRKGKLDALVDYGLVGFQKVEWFNRLSTFYAHLSWAKEAKLLSHDFNLRSPTLAADLWLKKAGPVVADAERAVKELQFGNDALNIPFAFQPGQPLGNPLLKQFGSFIVRSAAIPFNLSPNVMQGERTFRLIPGLAGKKVPLPPGVTDFGRLLGLSAIIYELGKNFLGNDITRYTGYAQVTEAYPFVREGRFSAEEGTIPIIPPVLDIPLQAIKALGTGDVELAKRTALRVVPFGVGAGKFAKYGWPGMKGLFNQLGGTEQPALPGVPQTPYADYRSPDAEGKVPFYSPTGELIDYRSPTQLILKGLGFPVPDDMVPQLDRFLVRNAEEMASYRREAADAMLSGDMAKYEGVAAAYGKRFKFQGQPLPLAISQAQVKARGELRNVARSERLLDRFPPEARPGYGDVVKGLGESRLGLPEGGLDQGETAKQRRAGTMGAETRAQQEGGFTAFPAFGGFKAP